MRMKAAVSYAFNEPLVLEELELDPPKAGEVLVKMMASGVCKSDIRAMMGHYPLPHPVVLGHEGAGIVEEVGPGVKDYAPGDHVVLSMIPSCGKCRWCHIGHPNKCEEVAKVIRGTQMDGGTRRSLPRDGTRVYGMGFTSTFAEYTVVPSICLVKVPDYLPLEHLCLLGCGFTTGFCAATNVVHVRPGEKVLVVGCGGLGLSAIQGLALQTPGMLIAVDLFDEKLAMAKHFGATQTFRNTGDIEALYQEIWDLTWGVGVDYAFDFAGLVGQDNSIQLGVKCLRKGGTMVFVGSADPAMESIPVSPFHLQQWQKSITGVLFGSAQFRADIPRIVEMYEKGAVNLKDMVTLEFPLEEINVAIENVHAKNKAARQVIRFHS